MRKLYLHLPFSFLFAQCNKNKTIIPNKEITDYWIPLEIPPQNFGIKETYRMYEILRI